MAQRAREGDGLMPGPAHNLTTQHENFTIQTGLRAQDIYIKIVCQEQMV